MFIWRFERLYGFMEKYRWLMCFFMKAEMLTFPASTAKGPEKHSTVQNRGVCRNASGASADSGSCDGDGTEIDGGLQRRPGGQTVGLQQASALRATAWIRRPPPTARRPLPTALCTPLTARRPPPSRPLYAAHRPPPTALRPPPSAAAHGPPLASNRSPQATHLISGVPAVGSGVTTPALRALPGCSQ